MSGKFYFGIALISCLAVQCAPSPEDAENLDCKQVEQLNKKALDYLFSMPDSAFHYASQVMKVRRTPSCASGIAQSNLIVGVVFFHQGVYQEAMDHLMKAADAFKKLKDKSRQAESLNQLGLVYYHIKQPDLALQAHQQAIALYEELEDHNGIAFSQGCIGRLYEKRKQYRDALVYQQLALQHYEKTNDQRGLATILENIGSIYEDQESYPLALSYFQRALKITEQTHDSVAMIVNMNNIGDNYRKTYRYTQAIAWTKKALELSSHLKDKYQLSSAYKDLSKIYSLAGDYENAYKNLEIGRNLYQEIYTRDASQQVKLFQTLFETERKNHAIQQLESDRELNRFIKMALASSVVLVTMLAGVVISRQRLKIRKNKEVIRQNEQIFETHRRLMEAEIANTHLQEQKLQHELETKAKALTTHTLHIISKNKTLEDIQQKLTGLLKEGPQDNRKQLKGLVKMIEQNFVQDNDWDDFRQIFEQVHQDFFDKLKQRATDLTPADVRLASLIRLQIPSRDIAVVLGISPDSLRIARYRLRKKLHLPATEKLSQFIGSL